MVPALSSVSSQVLKNQPSGGYGACLPSFLPKCREQSGDHRAMGFACCPGSFIAFLVIKSSMVIFVILALEVSAFTVTQVQEF
jgi:hypothetical protein